MLRMTEECKSVGPTVLIIIPQFAESRAFKLRFERVKGKHIAAQSKMFCQAQFWGFCLFVCLFVLFCFVLFFQTGFLCVALEVLELIL